MTLLLLVGLFGVLLIIIFKSTLLNMVRKDNYLVEKLSAMKWFHNYWLAGFFLFTINAVLFFSAILVLYVVSYFLVPFVHILVMLFSVILSILIWGIMNKAWNGTKRDRLKMGFIGSSFYLFLSLFFVFWLINLEPDFHGDDNFMQAIGLVFATIVTSVAFITCYVITGYSREKMV